MEEWIKKSDAMDAVMWGNGLDGSVVDDICEKIEALPSADRPQGWIPCSERLPREEEQDDELGVLVTLGNGYSGLQYDWYYDGHWYDWNGFVVAWMSLPKPYKEKEDAQ